MAQPSGKRSARPLDDDLRCVVITGGVAGAHTVTGIAPGDILTAVMQEDATSGVTAANLVAEFTISDVDEIDNTAGTNTTGDSLLVWFRVRERR